MVTEMTFEVTPGECIGVTLGKKKGKGFPE